MHAHLSPCQEGEIKDWGRGGKQGWEAAVTGTDYNNQWLGLRFPSLRTLSDVERDGKTALWQGSGSWSLCQHCGPVQTLWMGNVPALCPNPRAEERDKGLLACRCSWLWLQTLLQRERGVGGGSSHQKESLKGKLQRVAKTLAEDSLCMSGALQEGRERSGRASRTTDPLHCRRGHGLQSVKGLCPGKMLTCLKRAKESFPRGSPCFFLQPFSPGFFAVFSIFKFFFNALLKASSFRPTPRHHQLTGQAFQGRALSQADKRQKCLCPAAAASPGEKAKPCKEQPC